MGSKDYYKILEVHPEASLDVIRKAYKTLASRYHPDRHIPARKKWGEEKFKELSEAYHILSDPIKRRNYDRDGYSEQLAKESSTATAKTEEEAYFYYRMGLEHYQNAQKKTSWRILFGVGESDLKKARDDFITVLNEYPNGKYAEKAHFYYICSLMESYEYGEKFLKDTEEKFVEFLDEFPRSKWAAEVKLRFAKFYLFKKRSYNKENELLSDIIYLHHNRNLAQEAEILLEYAQNINQKLKLKNIHKKI